MLLDTLVGHYTHEQDASDRLRACWVSIARTERSQDSRLPLSLGHVRNLDSLGDFVYPCFTTIAG